MYILVDAAVLNSSGKNINIENYIKNEQKNFEDIFSGINFSGIEVHAKLRMRSIDDADDVEGKEHLVEIKEMKSGVGGNSYFGGLKLI